MMNHPDWTDSSILIFPLNHGAIEQKVGSINKCTKSNTLDKNVIHDIYIYIYII